MGLLQGIGKKCPIADQRVSRTLVSNSFCWRVLESQISVCHFFFLFCLQEKFGLKFWFPNSGSLLVSQMANYHSQKQAEQQLITTDNTQNSCERRVLRVYQDLVIIICKGVFFNLSIFPVHTNTLSTCLPTWLLITLSRFSWDSLFLICSGEAVCFCVAVKTRFDN